MSPSPSPAPCLLRAALNVTLTLTASKPSPKSYAIPHSCSHPHPHPQSQLPVPSPSPSPSARFVTLAEANSFLSFTALYLSSKERVQAVERADLTGDARLVRYEFIEMCADLLWAVPLRQVCGLCTGRRHLGAWVGAAEKLGGRVLCGEPVRGSLYLHPNPCHCGGSR